MSATATMGGDGDAAAATAMTASAIEKVTAKAATGSITVAAVAATAAPAARTRRIRAKGEEGSWRGGGLYGGDYEPSPAMQPCLPKEGDLARYVHCTSRTTPPANHLHLPRGVRTIKTSSVRLPS